MNCELERKGDEDVCRNRNREHDNPHCSIDNLGFIFRGCKQIRKITFDANRQWILHAIRNIREFSCGNSGCSIKQPLDGADCPG